MIVTHKRPVAPDLQLATAYPEVAGLLHAMAARAWPQVRGLFAGVDSAGFSLLAWAVAGHPAVPEWAESDHSGADAELLAILLAGDMLREEWEDRADEAEELLRELTTHRPDSVVGWEMRIVAAQVLEFGVAEVRRRYERLAEHAPNHLPAQRSLLHALLDASYDDDDLNEACTFALSCALEAPSGAPNAVLIVHYHLWRWATLGKAGVAYLRREDVQEDLLAAAVRSVWAPDYAPGFGWVEVRNAFAMAFSLAGNWDAAAREFAALGHLGHDYPWFYLGAPDVAFHSFRRKALRKGRRPMAGPGSAEPDATERDNRRRVEHPAVRLGRDGVAGMPVVAHRLAMRYGITIALALFPILFVVFAGVGLRHAIANGNLLALAVLAPISVVVTLSVAVVKAWRSRGPVLAADADGLWLRPEEESRVSAWLPWYMIESVVIQRFLGFRLLCVVPRDRSYESWFANPMALRTKDSRLGQWIIRVLRAPPGAISAVVSATSVRPSEMAERLRELAGGRCRIEVRGETADVRGGAAEAGIAS